MDALDAVRQARDLLESVTPLRRDCGGVCGAACCQSDEDGQGGMLLFPGEEALYQELPEGFTLTRDNAILPGMTLLTCEGRCDRSRRPLSCRLFPLTPVLVTENGQEKLKVRMDPRAFAVCPLCEQGIRGMAPEFGQAALQAARILCQCEEHKRYFRALARYFEQLKAW